jgi:thioredoxin reductase
MKSNGLPVAVVGAGPVGLAAAAHLRSRGEEVVVFEAGPTVGSSLLAWGHVRLFSPWRYVVDEVAGDLLAASGWTAPDPEKYPTGREIVERYLAPLAALPELRARIRLNAKVVAISRVGFDKMKTEGREDAPFQLIVRQADGGETPFFAKALVDASGTYTMPNPLGAAGLPAIGERTLADRIFYGIPDVRGVDRARYAGRRVLVVGSGHSAFNVLLDLVDLADEAPGTTVTWAVRRSGNRLQTLFGGGIKDALPARGELGARVERLIESGRLTMVTGFKMARLTATDEGIIVAGEDEVLPPVDEIVGATGFRPDLSILSELRLNLDPAVESPAALAPLIDPNVHSCGSVPPHGEEELRQPEPSAYIVGMKSYGRAPTFLLVTGYEQVRSIVAAIAGDWEAAREVRLVLPETGVCSTDVLAEREVACCAADAATVEDELSSCCGAAATAGAACCGASVPQVIQLTVATRGRCCG